MGKRARQHDEIMSRLDDIKWSLDRLYGALNAEPQLRIDYLALARAERTPTPADAAEYD